MRFANAINVVNDLSTAQKRGLLKRQLKTYLRPELLVLDNDSTIASAVLDRLLAPR